MDNIILDQQSQHWETNFSNKPEMFGLEPSYPAKKTLEILQENNFSKIVELGSGLGRDTLFFGQNLIEVIALDYSFKGISIINDKVKKQNLNLLIKTKNFDVRNKLPFKNNSVEICYSHMLYCMALTNFEIINLNKEIKRILKPGGLNIYTARNMDDGDYKKGIFRGENLYENDGFIVHFFSIEKVNSLLDGFKNIFIENFVEGKFPRKLYMVCNKKI